MKIIEQKEQEKICLNCRYLLWMVGIGLGIKCGNNKNAIINKKGELKSPFILSRRHSCEHFEPNVITK